MLQVLQAVQRAQASLSDMLAGVTLFPQTLLNVRLPSLAGWQGNAHLAAETRAVEAELAGAGRVLIRASGTEPVLRVMVETSDKVFATKMVDSILQALPGLTKP